MQVTDVHEKAVMVAQLRELAVTMVSIAVRTKAGEVGGDWLVRAQRAEKLVEYARRAVDRAEQQAVFAREQEREAEKREAEKRARATAPAISDAEREQLATIRARCTRGDGTLACPFTGAEANAFGSAMELAERDHAGQWRVPSTFSGARAHDVRVFVLARLASLSIPKTPGSAQTQVVPMNDQERANRL